MKSDADALSSLENAFKALKAPKAHESKPFGTASESQPKPEPKSAPVSSTLPRLRSSRFYGSNVLLNGFLNSVTGWFGSSNRLINKHNTVFAPAETKPAYATPSAQAVSKIPTNQTVTVSQTSASKSENRPRK